MEEVLISGMENLLQQPELMPDGIEQEIKKLLPLFMDINFNLSHARLLAEGDDKVRAWLSDLKEVAYHADDILDGFRYAKLQADALTGEKVRTGLLFCSKISSVKLPFYKPRVSWGEQGHGNDQIRWVFNKISELVKKMTPFKIQILTGDVVNREQLISSTLTKIDPIFVGRDIEKENIVQYLLNPPTIVSETIVRIFLVGEPGIGKTTFARFVCCDDRINYHFECILWVDVLPEFKIGKIAKFIIDQAIGKDCCLSEDDTDLLKHRINQELSGKRYLIVCNDVDGKDQRLRELISWLEQINVSGSCLIVLTNRQSLFLTNPHEGGLPALEPKHEYILFCMNAFPNGNLPEIYEDMVKEILDLCGRSALLVNLMGGLMRFKKEPAKWREVIDQLKILNSSGTLSINNNNKALTLSIIKLCYNYMSSETRQCLIFCSIFPFGYHMIKEVLIKLWMANGLFSLFPSDGLTSLEEKGDSILNELALRHFFENVGGTLWQMTRVIYNFCQDVAIHENIHQLNEKKKYDKTSQVCYLSMSGDSPIDFNTVQENYSQVRTLMSTSDSFVRTIKCSEWPKSNSLRALHLRSSSFEGDIFEVVRHMKHLRYLDLSSSRIKIIPESTCSLYNLQTLNLSNCLLLYQLPENMRYMRSLRHLYVHNCPKLKRMPPELGKLIDLQTLSAYIVGEHAGNGINEIKELNLGDLLELYNLCKVKDAAEAKVVNLVAKTNLEMLTLCWGGHQLVMSNKTNDWDVLEALKPHNGLKVLKIQQYGDPEFATWLTKSVHLNNLVELHLIGCSQCETLPAVCMLPSLQVLCLKHMPSLACIYSFSNGHKEDSSMLFPGLKRLALVDMKRLERWFEEETSPPKILNVPQLVEMEITKCPKLTTTPQVPRLKHFTGSIENHRQLGSVIALIAQTKSLVEAVITKASSDHNEPFLLFGADVQWDDISKLRIMRLDSTDIFFISRALPRSLLGFWRSLISLENLDICNCKSLTSWPLEVFGNLKKLKRLSFRMCPNLNGLFPRQLSEDEEHLPRLLTLEFYRCVSLKEIPKCCSVLNLQVDECPRVESISDMSNLEMLHLSCTSWTFLPAGLGALQKLESFRVSECYSLTNLTNELAGLTSLQILIINKCPRVKSLPDGLNQTLSGLQKFQVLECPELENYCRVGPYFPIISQIGAKRNDLPGSSTNLEGDEEEYATEGMSGNMQAAWDEEEHATATMRRKMPAIWDEEEYATEGMRRKMHAHEMISTSFPSSPVF